MFEITFSFTQYMVDFILPQYLMLLYFSIASVQQSQWLYIHITCKLANINHSNFLIIHLQRQIWRRPVTISSFCLQWLLMIASLFQNIDRKKLAFLYSQPRLKDLLSMVISVWVGNRKTKQIFFFNQRCPNFDQRFLTSSAQLCIVV